MLTFPYEIAPDSVTNIEPADYPVSVFTSRAGVDFTSTVSCQSTGMGMTLGFNSQSVQPGCDNEQYRAHVVESILNFYDETHGTGRSFLIPDDHSLWDYFGAVAGVWQSRLEFDTWRFVEKPDLQIAGVKNTWDIEIRLINKGEY